MTKKELIKRIKAYLKEQENYQAMFGIETGMAYDTDTNEGYANNLLSEALRVL